MKLSIILPPAIALISKLSIVSATAIELPKDNLVPTNTTLYISNARTLEKRGATNIKDCLEHEHRIMCCAHSRTAGVLVGNECVPYFSLDLEIPHIGNCEMSPHR
jgi:hypothetical protein